MIIQIRNAIIVCSVLAAGVLAAAPARAQITIADVGRGWLTSTGTNNGNTTLNSYFAGYLSGVHERDHFDFIIPKFNGKLLGVTLSLIEPITGHGGVPTSYTVYSLGAFGSYNYVSIGSGTEYGATALSSASDGTVINIALDAAAVAAITADEGGTFSLGGVDSGELSSGANNNYDFANTAGPNAALLRLTMTPEPGPVALLLGAGSVLIAVRRKRKG